MFIPDRSFYIDQPPSSSWKDMTTKDIADAEFLDPAVEALYDYATSAWNGDEPDEEDKEIIRAFCEIVADDVKTFVGKHHDYGRGNIARSGETGILIRVGDKLERLEALRDRSSGVSNEPVEDSWKDMSVYGVIARITRQGRWAGLRPGWMI